ncbi:DUF5058 family protein [Oceanobacillus salinisoli]|uniref:DUF5058 family protein n=1 Tax=Oceanobacillus salinisoli TaxID=2678611 RepID=UPI0012E298D9|nr:DUF5058 family protein [Oceanobacillus salinisoli]
MEEAMKLAGSQIVWGIALLILAVVIFQAIKFILLAKKTSKEIGMTNKEVNSALKTGAIAAIGPSFAIIIVAVSLVPFIGEALTLMRIGIIGSAPIESTGASLSANAYGTELGSAGFTAQAFTAVVWTLCIGGIGWLVFVALATKSMDNIQKKIVNRNEKSKQIMGVITTAAIVAAFGNLASAEMVKGFEYIVAALTASITMIAVTALANKSPRMGWLREWSLGIAILVSLVIGYFTI